MSTCGRTLDGMLHCVRISLEEAKTTAEDGTRWKTSACYWHTQGHPNRQKGMWEVISMSLTVQMAEKDICLPLPVPVWPAPFPAVFPALLNLVSTYPSAPPPMVSYIKFIHCKKLFCYKILKSKMVQSIQIKLIFLSLFILSCVNISHYHGSPAVETHVKK